MRKQILESVQCTKHIANHSTVESIGILIRSIYLLGIFITAMLQMIDHLKTKEANKQDGIANIGVATPPPP